MEIPSIRIIGGNSQAGTYILRILLKENTTLQFGWFKKGKLDFIARLVIIFISVPHFQKRDRLRWRGGSFGTQHGVVIDHRTLSEKRW